MSRPAAAAKKSKTGRVGTEIVADFGAEIGAEISAEIGAEMGTEIGAEFGTEFGKISNFIKWHSITTG